MYTWSYRTLADKCLSAVSQSIALSSYVYLSRCLSDISCIAILMARPTVPPSLVAVLCRHTPGQWGDVGAGRHCPRTRRQAEDSDAGWCSPNCQVTFLFCPLSLYPCLSVRLLLYAMGILRVWDDQRLPLSPHCLVCHSP